MPRENDHAAAERLSKADAERKRSAEASGGAAYTPRTPPPTRHHAIARACERAINCVPGSLAVTATEDSINVSDRAKVLRRHARSCGPKAREHVAIRSRDKRQAAAHPDKDSKPQRLTNCGFDANAAKHGKTPAAQRQPRLPSIGCAAHGRMSAAELKLEIEDMVAQAGGMHSALVLGKPTYGRTKDNPTKRRYLYKRNDTWGVLEAVLAALKTKRDELLKLAAQSQ